MQSPRVQVQIGGLQHPLFAVVRDPADRAAMSPVAGHDLDFVHFSWRRVWRPWELCDLCSRLISDRLGDLQRGRKSLQLGGTEGNLRVGAAAVELRRRALGMKIEVDQELSGQQIAGLQLRPQPPLDQTGLTT
jgi:hypothetical protein